MPKYKWDSPQDWLGDKINALHAKFQEDRLCNADIVVSELAIIANTIVNGTLNVDADDIQDAFQDEMEEEGYFRDADICKNLTREACVNLLAGICIECRDEETVEELRTAVEANLEDGSLAYEDVAVESGVKRA